MEKQKPMTAEDIQAEVERNEPWRWRNCRSIGLSVGFWPIEWGLSTTAYSDRFGGSYTLAVGPFEFTLSFNNGAAMRGDWE